MPRQVPPSLWISSTNSGVSTIWLFPIYRIKSHIASPESKNLFNSISIMKCKKDRSDNIIKSGAKPPHVTIPARVSLGLKKSFARGPASSKSNSWSSVCLWIYIVSFPEHGGPHQYFVPTGDVYRGSPREVIFIIKSFYKFIISKSAIT